MTITEFDYIRKFETIQRFFSKALFELEKGEFTGCRFFKSDSGYLVGKLRQEEIPVEVAKKRLSGTGQLRLMLENIYKEVG